MKFKTQNVDKLHCNDFISNSLGKNENLRQKKLIALFSCQTPLIKFPPKTQFPNCKVHPLLMWIDLVLALIWILVVTFSMDEITMNFKSHHADKVIFTYKAEGG